MSSRRREYAGALLLLSAGGVLCLAVPGLAWGEVRVAGGLTPTTVTVTGGDVVPFTFGVGLLALAAVVAIHATSSVGRRLLGGLVALAGAGVALWALVPPWPVVQRVLSWVEQQGEHCCELTGLDGHPQAMLATAAGGLVIAVAGAVVAVYGPRWPRMGTRYERRASIRPDGETDHATWDALDRGEDPTV